MVLWGQTRQRAFDDAREARNGDDDGVALLYYLEMNLGPEAVVGKPGVTNDVIPLVQPDLVSYSSYSSTNAFAKTDNVTAADAVFMGVLDFVDGKLDGDKTFPFRDAFTRRVFVGEYGSHASEA